MPDLKIIVHIAEQVAELMDGPKVLRRYRISSAKNGVGCETGSLKTPAGNLRIAKKIGDGCPTGTVFKSRAVTGEVWSADPANPLSQTQDDLVLSRVLWLEGCDPENINTLSRAIYFHGTNHEERLGSPDSHGCIRLSNADIEELFALVQEGTAVEVIG